MAPSSICTFGRLAYPLFHGYDMDYVKCRGAPTSQKTLSERDYTEEQVFQYAIKNHWRVIVYAGGKNYYLKGKDYSIQHCHTLVSENTERSSTPGKYVAILNWPNRFLVEESSPLIQQQIPDFPPPSYEESFSTQN